MQVKTMTTKHLSHPKMHRRYNQTYAEENETQFPNHQSLNDSECLTKERPPQDNDDSEQVNI